ncbi:MAG: RDD family protein [Acidimicrobiia bacterium]|nr:RDD family protein [Acidimicrobiia bacterium]
MADASSEGSRNRSLVAGLVGRVAPAVMRQIDTNDLVDALDVNVIADELDMDVLIDRLDVNAIAERLDMDVLIDRLDMAKLTAGATQDVAASGLDLVRRQIMRMDATVDRFSDRVLRRGSNGRPIAPSRLAALDDVVDLDEAPSDLHRRDVSGHYAGPVTRGLSILGDLAAVAGLQALLAWLVFVAFGVVFDADTSGSGRWIALAMLGAVFVAWFWIPVALFGRTVAMAVLGLAVVRRDGGIADGRRAFVRALFFPVSVIVPLCFIGLVVGKERRAFHDLIAGTTVVYDWGVREAQQPVTIREQLTARVRRRTDTS